MSSEAAPPADDLALPEVSESDGFAEEQDDTSPGAGFCVEDEKAVDGAGLPVGHLGAGAFQWEGVVFDAAQRGAQVGYHLLGPPRSRSRGQRRQRRREVGFR